MTPGPVPVPRHGARAGRQAADLGAIRRSDAILDLLASRRRIRARVLRDPAIGLLRSLAADVDATPRPGRPGWPAVSRHRAGRHHAPSPWPHAAAAATAAVFAIVAALAAAALLVATMLGHVVCGRWHNHHKRT